MAKTESAKPRTSAEEKRLLKRIGELEIQVETLQAARPSSSFGAFLKRSLIVILIILCALMLNLTTVSLWLQRTVVNTDVWTSKTSALLQDSSVRNDISAKITDEIFTATDTEQLIADIVPPRISGLAVPLTNNLKTYTTNKISELLASQKFQSFWQTANQNAHAGIVASLENGGKAPVNTDDYIVYINNDKLLLNLKPIVQQLQTELSGAGLGVIDNLNTSNINRTITLTEIQSLPTLLAAFNAISKAALIFSIIAIICGAGALALSSNKRQTIISLSVATIVLMVLNVQAIYLAQYPLIQQISNSAQAASSDSALAVFNILVSDLIVLNRVLMLIAIIVLLVALLSGPSKSALAFRKWINNLTNSENSPTFIRTIERHKTAVIASIAVVAALLIIFPQINGYLFPLVVVTIASLLCLWVYSLETQH